MRAWKARTNGAGAVASGTPRRGPGPAMKFQIERDVLAEAVGWASRALPARPVIPVLSGLLLQAAARDAVLL